MGQGGANNKMEGVKSRNNKPKPNVHFIPVLQTKKCACPCSNCNSCIRA